MFPVLNCVVSLYDPDSVSADSNISTAIILLRQSVATWKSFRNIVEAFSKILLCLYSVEMDDFLLDLD